jgi:hypothetical protein
MRRARSHKAILTKLMLARIKKIGTNTLAYFIEPFATKRKVFDLATRAQCYKTFYVLNLRMFVIS